MFIVIQSLLLIALYYQYGNKKRQSRIELGIMEQQSGGGDCLIESKHLSHLGEEQKEEKPKDTSRSRIMRFIDLNIMKGAERRLTIPTLESKTPW